MFAVVSPPTLQLVLKVLKDIDNWFVFGVKLGVLVKQFKKIKSSHLEGDLLERCKIDMLQYWLDNSLSALSWKDIVQALEETDQLVLAATAKHKYLLLTAGDCIKRDGACERNILCYIVCYNSS